MLKNWRDIDANRRGRWRIITKMVFAYIEVVLTFNLKGLYNQAQTGRNSRRVVLTFNLKGLYNICAVKP